MSGHVFLTDAIALASPSGRMSKRALKAAQARMNAQLFPPGYWEEVKRVPQPSERERNLRVASELRVLAARGISPRKNMREAERLEAKHRA